MLDEGLMKNKVHLSVQQGSASILVSLFSVNDEFYKCGKFFISFIISTFKLLLTTEQVEQLVWCLCVCLCPGNNFTIK